MKKTVVDEADDADKANKADDAAKALGGGTVVLGITGSIAAFKAVEIVRLLMAQGVRVIPVLTRGGAKFVGPVVFTGITKEPARLDMWDHRFAGEMHIDLAQQADVLVVAPATADMVARMAQGRADDLLTATALAFTGRVLVAPAMHPNMWSHPATRRNCDVLRADDRVRFVGPVKGVLANGDVGVGRMADPAQIVDAVMAELSPKDLAGRHVVVTAGPTVEDLDPVRFLSNRSSGKMGFAIAERAACRGARVTLIAGPVHLETPGGVCRVDVRSAAQMRDALNQALGPRLDLADALVMAAAVGDFRVARVSEQKIPRTEAQGSLALVPNDDILAGIGERRRGLGSRCKTVLVGFAVQTCGEQELVAKAKKKLDAKRVDLIVANQADAAFGKDTNHAWFVSRDAAGAGDGAVEEVGPMTKKALADRILDAVVHRWRVGSASGQKM